MTWMPVRLRADNESDLLAALKAAALTAIDDKGDDIPVSVGLHHRLVIRGTLYSATGSMLTDADTGFQYPEMTPVAGYHADLLTDDPAIESALASVTIVPTSPDYEWSL